jgi:hypothetical protein
MSSLELVEAMGVRAAAALPFEVVPMLNEIELSTEE